jgi:hypothetical protein
MQESLGATTQISHGQGATMNEHWTDDPERVERFVLGRLSGEEQSSFEMHIRGCPRCKEIVDRERRIIGGIRLYGWVELKKRLRMQTSVHDRSDVPWPHIVSIAAALIIVIGLGITFRWWGGGDLVVRDGTDTTDVSVGTPDVSPVTPEPPPEGRAISPSENDRRRSDVRPDASMDKSAPQSAIPSVPEKTAALHTDDVWESQWIEGVILSSRTREAFRDLDAVVTEKRGETRIARERPAGPEEAELRTSRNIVVSQKPERAIPLSQKMQQQMSSSVLTMLRQTDEGVFLTVFSDTLDLERGAVRIEQISEDSLLLIIDGTTIGYKIPRVTVKAK